MELSVSERLAILDALPKEGDVTTLKIVRKLRETLSFSEVEHKALKFEANDNMIQWDEKYDKPKNLVIGEKAMDVIKKAFKDMNSKHKLTETHLDIYDKVMAVEDASV